jgi:hypothetical protein
MAQFDSPWLATEMKSYAKAASQGLSNWAVDRRNEDDADA